VPKLGRALLDLLLPPACFRCGRPGEEALCGPCARALPAAPWIPVQPPLAAAAAGAAYAAETEAWVRRFKYPAAGVRLDPTPEVLLGELLQRAAQSMPRAALVVPVPLHPRRIRARGFNPAGRLAKRLARELGLAFDPVALVRLRDTPSQTGLSATARRRNVAAAFAPVRALPEAVWLVDDVITTGSTVAAAARALRRAGARRIVALAPVATP